jgi:hypothetical protein
MFIVDSFSGIPELSLEGGQKAKLSWMHMHDIRSKREAFDAGDMLRKCAADSMREEKEIKTRKRILEHQRPLLLIFSSSDDVSQSKATSFGRLSVMRHPQIADCDDSFF